jgi:hypothetical protein
MNAVRRGRLCTVNEGPCMSRANECTVCVGTLVSRGNALCVGALV